MPFSRPAALPAVVAVALMVLLPAGVESQGFAPGARVRLTQASGERHQGTVEAIGSDSVRITGARGTPVTLSLADVQRTEVSLGRQRQFWKHFGLTTMGLVAVGGGVSAASWTPCEEDGWFSCMFVPESRGQAMLAGAVVGGLVGIPVGVVVGAAVRREQWAPVQQAGDRPRQVSVRPIVGNRIGASATLHF